MAAQSDPKPGSTPGSKSASKAGYPQPEKQTTSETQTREQTASPVAGESQTREQTASPVAEGTQSRERTRSPVSTGAQPREQTRSPVSAEAQPREHTRSPVTTEASATAHGLVTSGPIQAETDDYNDGDSAIGTLGAASSTGSLAASIFEYRVLHGRTYNRSPTEYWAPNDVRQNEGLDLMHHALTMMLDDQLFLAPIGDSLQRVLDVGTGTGCWAIDFADAHPGTEVIGTDLSPIQPTWVPPNVSFQIDDCLLEWTWPANHFDFVHFRSLYGSIPDWDELYSKAFKHLRPGGWLQDLEMDVWPRSDHVPIGPDHIYRQWGELYYDVGERTGRTFAICTKHMMKETMERAGFVDVTEVKMKVPLGSWPRDMRLKQVGELCLEAVDQSLEGYGMFLFTSVLGWSPEQVLVYTSKVRSELKKRSNCPWVLTTVVYGRKP
jgi:SAM-dependent methyltransferase